MEALYSYEGEAVRKAKPYEPDKDLEQYRQDGSNLLHISAAKLKDLGYKTGKVAREGSLLEAAKGLYIVLDELSARGFVSTPGHSKIYNAK